MAVRKVLPCRGCGKILPLPVLKDGNRRAGRDKYCSLECRFTSWVDKTPGHGPHGDCWLWTGAKHYFGYGMFTVSQKPQTAHAMSWTIANGRPPAKGMYICHACDNPPCVNPTHLDEKPPQGNTDDKIHRGRQLRGADNKHSKLTDAEVVEIRASNLSNAKLGKMYGVSRSLIGFVKTRRNWKHVA